MSEPAARGRRMAPILVLGIVALGVLAFYVARYPVRGFRVPLGSDTPVYIWWSRLAGAVGLGPGGTGARPGIVSLPATLSRVTGVSVAAVIQSLAPALAASLALAAAAFARAGRGERASRPNLSFALVGLFVGAYLSFLVPGYLSTLGFGLALVAALACLAEGFGQHGRGSVGAAAALVAAAGLAHPVFLLFGAAIACGGLVALLPSWRRDRALGVRFERTAAGRVVVAGALGVPVFAAGLVASGAGGALAVDTSRDAVLRRTGLGSLLRESYLRKLRHDFPWWRVATLAGLALTAAAAGHEDVEPPSPHEQDRRRLFGGTLAAWLLVTVGAVVALLVGSAAAGQRLADLCLPLPILAGFGLAGLRLRTRGLTLAAVVAGSALFLTVAWSAWAGSHPLVTPEQVGDARDAGAALAATTPGTPLVLLMDDDSDKPALFVTRYANTLRDGVPGARVGDVHVVVGTPADFLAGRITRTGQEEHDRLAADSWLRLGPLLARDPLVVEVRSFDPAGFAAALALPGSTRPAPGVVVLPGSGGRPHTGPPLPTTLGEPGSGPISPWLPVGLAPLLLVLLAVVGWPWARMALPAARTTSRLALAPALGFAALSLASVAVDAVGMRSSTAGGWVAASLALLGWPFLALARQFWSGTPEGDGTVLQPGTGSSGSGAAGSAAKSKS